MIRRSVSRMSDLINDAMDFTRGRPRGRDHAGNAGRCGPVEAVLQQVVGEVRTISPARGRSRRISISYESIRYDRKRMAQLFTNLLSNAMTHGKADQPVDGAGGPAARGGLTLSWWRYAADPIPPWKSYGDCLNPFREVARRTISKGWVWDFTLPRKLPSPTAERWGVTSEAEETCFTLGMASAGPPVGESLARHTSFMRAEGPEIFIQPNGLGKITTNPAPQRGADMGFVRGRVLRPFRPRSLVELTQPVGLGYRMAGLRP